MYSKNGRFRRGSALVFTSMIMLGIMFLAIIILRASYHTSKLAETDSLLVLAGRSCLAEYDIPLYEKYGIFAVYGDKSSLNERLCYYIDKSDNAVSVGNIDSDAYGLIVKDVLEKEIVRLVKSELKGDALKWALRELRESENSSGEKNKGSDAGTRGDSSENGIYIMSSELDFNVEKKELPSRGATASHFTPPDFTCTDCADFLRKNGEKLMLNYYVMHYFNRYSNQDIYPESFFNYEAEYILFGKYSDEENLAAFKRKFLIYREALNALHIVSSPEKMEEVTAFAAALPPGANIGGAAAVIAAWALAESANDWKLLLDGKRVPVVKSTASWAVPFMSSLISAVPENTFYPMQDMGFDYDRHLLFFLCAADKDMTLMRIMDIMQLNMRKNYYPEFKLSKYSSGFYFECKMGKQELKYEHVY